MFIAKHSKFAYKFFKMGAEFYNRLKRNNKNWVKKKTDENPDFFKELAKEQKPPAFIIGCADSRVPINDVIGADAGELFVQRNIANMVIHSDMNLLSVLEFAVNVLEVPHIIVCGHYGCGGVKAAMDSKVVGLIDNWLGHIKDAFRLHADEINSIEDPKERYDRCVEINVQEQVYNLGTTKIVQNAWRKGMELKIHGWVYDLETGLIKDLGVDMGESQKIDDIYKFNF